MDKVKQFLSKKFPNNEFIQNYVYSLYNLYCDWNLKDTKFETDFTDGSDTHFHSYLWEMLLAYHLKSIGYDLSSADSGPDFKINLGKQTIWIEAVCPSPVGLPNYWLKPPQNEPFRMSRAPHEKILLRLTAALKEKKDQLKRHLSNGIVDRDDIYIIALNTARLRWMDMYYGLSQYPYALEAVIPIGSFQVSIDPKTHKTTGTGHAYRDEISNHNDSLVRTDSFLNEEYCGISAVFASDAGLKNLGKNNIPIAFIHNHKAKTPAPSDLFYSTEEFTIKESTETISIIPKRQDLFFRMPIL